MNSQIPLSFPSSYQLQYSIEVPNVKLLQEKVKRLEDSNKVLFGRLKKLEERLKKKTN